MKRMMGTVFAIENREAKDKYIYSNFKNTLSDSHSDSINYGSDIALRKLLVSMISVEIAKNMEETIMHPQKIFVTLCEKTIRKRMRFYQSLSVNCIKRSLIWKKIKLNNDNYCFPTIQRDLDKITTILYETFEIPAFKRDYDKVFETISKILFRYGINENNRNLRFRFIL